jgi:anti-sigma-K factor RskA
VIGPEEKDPTSLTGAYALDAVSDNERAALERHLSTSEATRNEVTELQDTAVLLGLATTPVTPSAELKARLMAQVAVTPQLAPVAAVPVAVPASTRSEFTAQQRWFSRTAFAITAAAAAVAILIGGGVVVANLGNNTEAPLAATGIQAIRAADDAQQATADISTGGIATLVWSGELAQAALIAEGMKPLSDGQVYELWYIGETGPRAAGTFTVDENGTVRQMLEGDMQAGDLVGVTIEPAGGSEQPTTDPIVGIQA